MSANNPFARNVAQNQNIFSNSNTGDHNSQPAQQARNSQQGTNIFGMRSNNAQSTNIFNANPRNDSSFNPLANQSANMFRNLTAGDRRNQNKDGNKRQYIGLQRIPFRELLQITNLDQNRFLHQMRDSNQEKQLLTCYEQFEVDQNRKKLFDEEVKTHQLFGLTQRQIHFKNVPRNQQVNKFLEQLVKAMKQLVDVDQLIAHQFLKRVLSIDSRFMSGFYNAIDHKSLGLPSEMRVNQTFLYSVFVNQGTLNQAQLKVNRNCQLFITILKQMVAMFYAQYQAMLELLGEIMLTKKKTIKLFFINKFINNDNLVAMAWNSLKKLIGRINRKPKQPSLDQSLIDKLSQKLRRYETRICIFSSQLLQNVVSKYYNWPSKPISNLIPSVDAVTIIDATLHSNQVPNDSKQQFEGSLLHLLVQIFPFYHLRLTSTEPTLNRTEICNVILNTKSFHLEPVRILIRSVVKQHQNQRGRLRGRPVQNEVRPETRQLNKQLEKMITSNSWTMNSIQWKFWLGLYLQYNLQGIILHQEILNKIVQLCKEIMKVESRQFWDSFRNTSENNIYFYHKEINRLINRIGGSRPLRTILPILTQSLGKKGFANKFSQIQLIVDPQMFQERVIEPIRVTMMDRNESLARGEVTQPEYYIQSDSVPKRQDFSRIGEMIEFQLEFLTRIIEVYPDRLNQIQDWAYDGRGANDKTGLSLIAFLLNCLRIVSSVDDSINATNLRCIRLIIETVDYLYTKKQIRPKVIYAICAHYQQNGREAVDIHKIIKVTQIRRPKATSSAKQKAKIKQECRKLRKALSRHLNNILKLTHMITTDFPIRKKLQQIENYSFLNSYIENGNFEQQQEWLQQKFPYIANPWFYDLLYLLCGTQKEQLVEGKQSKHIAGTELGPIDLQSIRLILLKCRMPALDQLQQYEALTEIIQILNNNETTKTILRNIEPRLKEKQMVRQHYYLLHDMSNLAYDSILATDPSLPGCDTAHMTNSINNTETLVLTNAYDKTQKSKIYNAAVRQIRGRIAGSLQIIETILKIHQQSFQFVNTGEKSGYVLLKELNLYAEIVNFLTTKNGIYHYQVPDRNQFGLKTTLKQHKIYEQNLLSYTHKNPLLQNRFPSLRFGWVADEQDSLKDPCLRVNLLHVLSSYINFEVFLLPQIVSRYENKERNFKIEIRTSEEVLHEVHRQSDVPAQTYALRTDWNTKIKDEELYDNLLSQPMNPLYLRDYSIMGNIVRIFSLLSSLSLSFAKWRGDKYITGKTILDCINSRSYQSQNTLPEAFREQHAIDFYRGSLKIINCCPRLVRDPEQAMLMKCQVFQLLGISLKADRLGDIVVGNFLPQISQIISKELEYLEQFQLPLLSKIVFFVCVLVQKYYKGNNGASFKVRPEELGQRNCRHLNQLGFGVSWQEEPILSFMRYPTNFIRTVLELLFAQYRKYSKLPIATPLGQNRGANVSTSVHYNILAQKEINQITLFKTTLDSLLQLLLMTFATETVEIMNDIIHLLVEELQVFVCSPLCSPTNGSIQKLGLNMRNKLEITRSSNGFRLNYDPDRFLKTLWCSSNWTSYGRNYQYDPILSFYHLLLSSPSENVASTLNEKTFQIYRTNTFHSVFHAQQYLTQTYATLMINLISLGKYGHSLSELSIDQLIPLPCIETVKCNRFQVSQSFKDMSLFSSGQNIQYAWRTLKSFLQNLLTFLDTKLFDPCSLDSLYFLAFKTFRQMQQIVNKTVHMKNNLLQHSGLAKRMLYNLPRGFSVKEGGLTLRGKLLLISSLITVFVEKRQQPIVVDDGSLYQNYAPLTTNYQMGRNSRSQTHSDSLYVDFYTNINMILVLLNSLLKYSDTPKQTFYEKSNTENSLEVNANLALICGIVLQTMKPVVKKLGEQDQQENLQQNSNEMNYRFNERHPVYIQFMEQVNQALNQILSIYEKYHEPSSVLYPSVINTVSFAVYLKEADPSVFSRLMKIIVKSNDSEQNSQNTTLARYDKRSYRIKETHENKRRADLPSLPAQLLVWHYAVLARITLEYPDWQSLIYDYICKNVPFIEVLMTVQSNKLTLLNIMQFKHLSSLILCLIQNNLTWNKQNYRGLLEQVFAIFLKSDILGIARENSDRLHCVATSRAEEYLRCLRVYQEQNYRYRQNFGEEIENIEEFTRPQKFTQLFELIWRTRLLEGLRFYLLLINSGFQHSNVFAEFYSKIIFNNNPSTSYESTALNYNEMIWYTISRNLSSIIAFLENTLEFMDLSPSTTTKLLQLQAYITQDIDFGFAYSLLGALFEPTERVQEWVILFLESTDVLVQSVVRFINIWNQNEWKAKAQSQQERQMLERGMKRLINKMLNTRIVNQSFKDIGQWAQTAFNSLNKAIRKDQK